MDGKKNGAINSTNGHVSNGDINSSKEEPKLSCLQKISHKIISVLETAFYRLGRLIGTYPWRVMLISTIVTGIICIAAPFTFTESADGDDTLWVPVNAKVLDYKSWVESVFPSTVRFGTMIFVSDNVLTPTVLSAMWTIYNSSISLTTGANNFSTLCIQSGSNCLVNSILELWSYDETTILAASQADIKTKINTATTSPMYFNSYDVTTVLGGKVYDGSGHIDSATATKMTWFIQGDDAVKDQAEAWEQQLIDLGQKEHSGISTTYVFAIRSFSDEAGGAIRGDIAFLSAGYVIVIVYITIMLGKFNCLEQRFGLAIAGVVVVGMSIGICFSLASLCGFEYGPLHSVLPFLLLGIGVDDMFVIVGALKNLSDEQQKLPLNERIGKALRHSGASITVTSLTDIMAFFIGATTLLPALRSFCIFAAFGIIALYGLSTTFFVSAMAVDVKRAAARLNACCCFYKHKPEYKPNNCSQKEYLPAFILKFYAPNLLKFPVKIVVLVLTAGLFGLTIWGTVNLEQKFEEKWFLPSDSYAYDYLTASDKYFSSGQEQAGVYCKNIDYFGKKTEMESLYTQLTASNYVVNGTVDSWFKSYTDWLSTTSDASVIAQIDATTKYPLDSTKFYDLLYQFVTTESAGLRFSRNLKFSNTSSVLGLTGSKISFYHPSVKDTVEGFNVLDGIQSLVAGVAGSDCFPYSQIHLTWESNKVIRQELYRNIALAAVCVFIICLVLIANIWTSLMVFSCVALTFVNVGGFMHFWGLTIDVVTCVQLILAIGLAVDYSAHIGHCFMTFQGGRNERVKATLVEIGGPVISGGFSTFLAFVLLAVSKSYVFTTFFKVLFLVVIFGLFHGLVYLPVLLSMVGPGAYFSADRRYQHDKKERDEENGVDNYAMEKQFPPPDYDVNETKDKVYIPPPDYTPPLTRKYSNRVSPEKR
ncbi:patched domain-containing protein 3-like isoform X1 [Mytilus edulis]|uniref:patched domain-containing protein 3-like isoform X1 n=1 Tax=Mytilus edulis TaxID=6550 RepID=UPI0039F0A440